MQIIQKIKDILGISLLGKLSSNLKQYQKKRRYIFDSNNIFCGVTEWTSPRISYSVWAMTYCDDPNIGGIDINNHFHFWRSKNFDNKNEAVNFLEHEIINASKKFPDTKFFEIQDNECKKYYLNGKWEKCDGVPHIRYCHGCGYSLDQKDSIICPKCGEPLIFE